MFRDQYGAEIQRDAWFCGLLALVFAPIWIPLLAIFIALRWLGSLGNWLADRAEMLLNR